MILSFCVIVKTNQGWLLVAGCAGYKVQTPNQAEGRAILEALQRAQL